MRRLDKFNACDYTSRHIDVQEFADYKMKIVWLTSDSNWIVKYHGASQKQLKVNFDQLVRTVSWELKEMKKKVSKKFRQVRQKAAAPASKIFWKRMFDLKVAR